MNIIKVNYISASKKEDIHDWLVHERSHPEACLKLCQGRSRDIKYRQLTPLRKLHHVVKSMYISQFTSITPVAGSQPYLLIHPKIFALNSHFIDTIDALFNDVNSYENIIKRLYISLSNKICTEKLPNSKINN